MNCRFSSYLLLILLLALLPLPVHAGKSSTALGVQAFLDAQPGLLSGYTDGDESAATSIESNGLYYGISPRLHLALLETVSDLLSNPTPTDAQLRQPFGAAGPDGFAAQIEWASRELRAGLGPYERPPTLRFTNGVTFTLTLDQAPEGVAVQRFLANGRTFDEWQALVARFGEVFEAYFNNELPDMNGIGSWGDVRPPPAGDPTDFTLLQPWPAGTDVVHLAYFDHVYPTVDSGGDGNGYVVTYTGQGNVQYDGHDGHDYFFPNQPIGTPMLAAAPGIAYARTHRGNGVVILHPGGYETVYWHLDGFAERFANRIDTNEGVWVEAGDFLGTSGKTGFTDGTPHLHFEVRRYGRQVDPYGWYGPDADPCASYAGCLASSWLWDSSLLGSYDFTPPDGRIGDAQLQGLPTTPFQPDTQPPIGTLTLDPPRDLLFHALFDGHVVQSVGNGFPIQAGTLQFEPGHNGEALQLRENMALTYPISDNLQLEAGTISVWANLPERYPSNSIDRHYLFAASANPGDSAGVYSGTLALRRDLLGPGDAPRWNFWTTGQAGDADRNDLAMPDTLGAGWHHFVVTWDADEGTKTLSIDGVEVASTRDVILPVDVGAVLQLGRFTYGGSLAGVALDDLRIYRRALNSATITVLATYNPVESAPLHTTKRTVRIDTNAIDAEGGIVAVQIGRDGVFEDPHPYYDTFRWRLPEVEGEHEIAVRYFDRAGNSTTLTQSITLDLPPRVVVRFTSNSPVRATLAISATDEQTPLEMQVSQWPDFRQSRWQPLQAETTWIWQDAPRRLYVRVRDGDGTLSRLMRIDPPQYAVHLPLLVR